MLATQTSNRPSPQGAQTDPLRIPTRPSSTAPKTEEKIDLKNITAEVETKFKDTLKQNYDSVMFRLAAPAILRKEDLPKDQKALINTLNEAIGKSSLSAGEVIGFCKAISGAYKDGISNEQLTKLIESVKDLNSLEELNSKLSKATSGEEVNAVVRSHIDQNNKKNEEGMEKASQEDVLYLAGIKQALTESAPGMSKEEEQKVKAEILDALKYLEQRECKFEVYTDGSSMKITSMAKYPIVTSSLEGFSLEKTDAGYCFTKDSIKELGHQLESAKRAMQDLRIERLDNAFLELRESGRASELSHNGSGFIIKFTDPNCTVDIPFPEAGVIMQEGGNAKAAFDEYLENLNLVLDKFK